MNYLSKYKDEQTIKNLILDMAQRKRQVIYGQQSVNQQVPVFLQRKTKDFDIYAKNPKESAEELATKLNKEFKNGFKSVKGVHKGTYKVKKGDTTIADYTSGTKRPKSKKILGVSYASLEYQKSKLKKLIKQKEAEYRRKKDIDTLDKLKQWEMTNFLMS
jgi:hypothetical protein